MKGTPFRGIFYSFGRHYPKASIDKLVSITTSSNYPGRGKPIYVIDPHFTYTNENNWITQSRQNSYFQFTFLRDSLHLTSYSLKARTDKSINMPNEWTFEGSNDETNWTLIHRKSSGDELSNAGNTIRYYCKANESFRSFKITQLETNRNTYDKSEQYIFGLNKLEVYGKLDIEFVCPSSCRRNTINYWLLIYILVND